MEQHSLIDVIFGMPKADVVSTLSDLSDTELETFASRLDRLIDNIEDNVGHEVVEARVDPKNVSNLQFKYQKELTKIADDLASKKITLSQYNKKMHSTIEKNFTKAYQSAKKDLTEGDKEWIRRAANAEVGFAMGWGKDIKAGRGASVPMRSGRFSRALAGIAWNADVEQQKSGTRIYWRLGQADHCIDCIILSINSPYTKESLPTVPLAGDTQCHSNCKCRLEYRRGKITKREKEKVASHRVQKDKSLFQMLKPPPPPKGLRVPTAKERLTIDNMTAELNFQRRLIAEKTAELELAKSKAKQARIKKELKKAIAARKAANAELIDYLDKRSIHDVPIYSVDDVITGADISLRAEADIFKHSISGLALDAASEKSVTNLAAQYERDVGRKFEE